MFYVNFRIVLFFGSLKKVIGSLAGTEVLESIIIFTILVLQIYDYRQLTIF